MANKRISELPLKNMSAMGVNDYFISDNEVEALSSKVPVSQFKDKLDQLDATDSTHTSQIASITTKNNQQDSRLNSVESVNTSQNSRLSSVESINSTQTSNISSLTTRMSSTESETSYNRILIDRKVEGDTKAGPYSLTRTSLGTSTVLSSSSVGRWVVGYMSLECSVLDNWNNASCLVTTSDNVIQWLSGQLATGSITDPRLMLRGSVSIYVRPYQTLTFRFEGRYNSSTIAQLTYNYFY